MKARQVSIIAVIIVLAIAATCSMASAAEILASRNLGPASYTASTSYNAGSAPYIGFDGNIFSFWNAGKAGGWLEVDLGRTLSISRVYTGIPSQTGIWQGVVWYSNTPIGDYGYAETACTWGPTGDANIWFNTPGLNFQARYVQLQNSVPDGWTAVREFEVYAVPGALSGTVLSTADNTPVAGVSISTCNGAFKATSGADGKYTLTLPGSSDATSPYVLTLAKDGYFTKTVNNVMVPENSTTSQDLTIEPMPSPNLVGTVRTNDNGLPIVEGVTVSTSDGGYFAATNAQGLYQLSLPIGTYTIVATKSGYKDFSQQVTITSTTQPQTLDITFISTALLSIKGTVKGTEAGNPGVAGATVSTVDGGYKTTTATDGTYRLAVLRGTTRLMVTHPQRVMGVLTFDGGTNDEITGQDINLDRGMLLSKGIPTSSYYASLVYQIFAPSNAFDGYFGGNSRWTVNSALGWLEVDLGGQYLISKVMVSPNMAPNGDATNELRVSSSPILDAGTGATLAETFSGMTNDMSFLTKDFAPATIGRYVQIKKTAGPSWDSVFEFQVYGPVCTVSGTVKSTVNGLAAVAGATVSTPNGAFSTTTDANGAYSLVAPAGNLTLVALKAGLSRLYVTKTALANSNVTMDFDLKNPMSAAKIGDFKGIPDGIEVTFTDPLAVVASSTTFRDGTYYIEDLDRTAGIKAIPLSGLASVNSGDRAVFSGMLSTDDTTGQRYFTVFSINNQTAGDEIRPLAMSNKAIAGAGLTPNALLVTTWGKATYVDPDRQFIYVDDGSGVNDGSIYAGLKVAIGAVKDIGVINAAKAGDNVNVTGIARYTKVGTTVVPEVVVRSAKDIDNPKFEHVVVHQSDFALTGETSDKQWRTEIHPGTNDVPQSTITFTKSGILCSFPSPNEYWIRIECAKYNGMALSDLTSLKWSELNSAAPSAQPGRTIMVILRVDTNGDGATDEQLAFEPYYHQAMPFAGILNTWQVWDAFNNGLWSKVVAGDFSGTRDAPQAFSSYITPDAKLATLSGEGAITFAVGDYNNDGAAGLVATLGNVTIGTATAGTTVYSFAPDPQ